MGDLLAAKSSFLFSLSILPHSTQNLIKLARIHFEQGDDDAGFSCFEDAIIHDGDDPDIYHHRGQGMGSIACSTFTFPIRLTI